MKKTVVGKRQALTLNRNTLRVLTQEALENVDGALANNSLRRTLCDTTLTTTG